MNGAQRAVLEAEIAALCEKRDYQRAATLAIEQYGPELLGFLVALHGDRQEAVDVFSQLCEDLWRGLEGFERRASFRTWAYTLARHALYRFQRTEKRRDRMNSPLSDCPAISEVAERVRTSTLDYLRSHSKRRLSDLRSSLPVEEQMLLILRVDRSLGWLEIARVLHDGKAGDDEAIQRESVRLRKRFQLVKDKLRELARAEGLLGESE